MPKQFLVKKGHFSNFPKSYQHLGFFSEKIFNQDLSKKPNPVALCTSLLFDQYFKTISAVADDGLVSQYEVLQHDMKMRQKLWHNVAKLCPIQSYLINQKFCEFEETTNFKENFSMPISQQQTCTYYKFVQFFYIVSTMIFVSVFSFKHRGNISVIITVVVFAVVVNVKFFSRSGNGQDIILKWIHYLRAGQANVLKTRTLAS